MNIPINSWTSIYKDIKPSKHNIDALHNDGYMIVRNHFDKSLINQIYKKFSNDVESGKIGSPSGNPVRTKNVLVDYPESESVVFDQKIIDICNQYYGHIPFLSNINIKRNYFSRPQITETLKFHEDPEAGKLIKVFIYLNDVDIEHGPFTYVRESHKIKIPYNKSKIRWGDQEIEKFYGKENICHLTGEAGDVILADTSGFHKGLFLKQDERTMMTLYFLNDQLRITPAQAAEALMPLSMYEGLSPNIKPVGYFTTKL